MIDLETRGQDALGFRALAASLGRVDENVSDAERIEQLAALESLKAAAAAAQVRVTAGFVASQEQVSIGWREHARVCSEAGDFDGWRTARDNADRASWAAQAAVCRRPDQDRGGHRGHHADGNGSSEGSGEASRQERVARRMARTGIAAQIALARAESPHRGSQHVTLALTLTRHLSNVLAWLQAGVLGEWRATLIVRECAVLTPDQQKAPDAELAETIGRASAGWVTVSSCGT